MRVGCICYGANTPELEEWCACRGVRVFLHPSEMRVLGRVWGPNVEVREVKPIPSKP